MLKYLFNKIAGHQGCNSYRKIFKKSYFEEHLLTTASVLNDTHMEELGNTRLAASDVFHMFTQSINFF